MKEILNFFNNNIPYILITVGCVVLLFMLTMIFITSYKKSFYKHQIKAVMGRNTENNIEDKTTQVTTKQEKPKEIVSKDNEENIIGEIEDLTVNVEQNLFDSEADKNQINEDLDKANNIVADLLKNETESDKLFSSGFHSFNIGDGKMSAEDDDFINQMTLDGVDENIDDFDIYEKDSDFKDKEFEDLKEVIANTPKSESIDEIDEIERSLGSRKLDNLFEDDDIITEEQDEDIEEENIKNISTDDVEIQQEKEIEDETESDEDETDKENIEENEIDKEEKEYIITEAKTENDAKNETENDVENDVENEDEESLEEVSEEDKKVNSDIKYLVYYDDSIRKWVVRREDAKRVSKKLNTRAEAVDHAGLLVSRYGGTIEKRRKNGVKDSK